MIGDILWTPPADVRETTEVGRFMNWVRDHRGIDFEDFRSFYDWSVTDLDGFWGSLAEFYELKFHSPYKQVLAERRMPGAKWFTGVTINYAEHMVGRPEDADRVAVYARSQTRDPTQLTFGDLRSQVARARAGLQRLGVGRGDRVVAYMPNIPETLVAYLATMSLGAIWATCSSEFGPRSVVDRFSQIEPKVLLFVPSYTYRDRHIPRGEEVAAIRAGLPTLEHVVGVPYGAGEIPDDAVTWEQLLAQDAPLAFEPVDWNHPSYVLFSSGTTGLPKAIVHGHGGQLIEHHKNQGLVWDLKPGQLLQWFSTTAWMIWNATCSSLLLGSAFVMLDGDPQWPDLREQWRVAEELRTTTMGVSPVYLMACRKAGLKLGEEFDLSAIRTVCTAGSPLPAEGYRYVYETLGPDVVLLNGSGGTDICSGMVCGCVAQPVYEGQITSASIGVDVHSFDPDGNEVIGELGEMVITSPLPSMPVALWGDSDGSRYRDAYFDMYPGIWRQGDWIQINENGTCVLSGRSDATLNRGGVRLGTGEFYAVIENLHEIADSLVVHLEDPDGGAGQLLLFVVPAEGVEVDDALKKKIAQALRSELSPRHVPDELIAVDAIPRTLTGKKLESPVKRILRGESAERVASRGSLLNPGALDQFVEFAAGGLATSQE